MDESSLQRVRGTLFEVIRNQMRDRTPPETKRTHDRLRRDGFSKEETMRLIAAVLLMEMNDVIREGRVFDEEGYIEALQDLPELQLEEPRGQVSNLPLRVPNGYARGSSRPLVAMIFR